MWLIGLELGLAAVLVAIVLVALRTHPENNSKDSSDD